MSKGKCKKVEYGAKVDNVENKEGSFKCPLPWSVIYKSCCYSTTA